MQLDVSVEMPEVIEEGTIIGGDFVPGDVGTTGFLNCLAKDLTVGTFGCLFSNCGYAACMAAVAGGSLIDCGWSYVFGE